MIIFTAIVQIFFTINRAYNIINITYIIIYLKFLKSQFVINLHNIGTFYNR